MQRDEAWFAKRAGKFTGSRFEALMARTKSGPSASREQLLVTLAIERIHGTCVETYTNAAMQRGIDLEAEALLAYEAREMCLIERVDFVQHPTLKNVGVSPDGLVGADGLVEVKCPANPARHIAAMKSGAHVVEYAWQIQGQLWVTGRIWCDAASYDPRFPPGAQLAVTRVCRDENMIQQLERECVVAEKEVAQHVKWIKKYARENA